MGAIMAMGIAVANSILLVTFAERSRHEGRSPREAAEEGARGRLRAILMTAAAMICGMVPMAVGWGEGGAAGGAAGPRGDRRADRLDLRHALHSAVHLRDSPGAGGRRPRRPSTPWTLRADTMMQIRKRAFLPP